MDALLQQQYIRLTRFLGETLGPDYEIAFYDLTVPEPCVIALANIGVSGRQLGSPLSESTKKLIETKAYMTMDSKVNYSGIGLNGKMLRLSTFFVKNADGIPVGLISIAFDDSRYQQLSDQLLKLRHPDAFVESHFVYDSEHSRRAVAHTEDGETEVFTSSVSELFSKTIQQAASGLDVPPKRMTGEERAAFICQLKEAGIFNLKQSIPEVAKVLGCSPATVYRHLGRCKGK